jgi:hypothetical protein
MADPHLILCGGAGLSRRAAPWTTARLHALQIGKEDRDVHLDLGRLTRRIVTGLPDVAADLVELAAYVYSADQMVHRGGPKEFEYGQKWVRHFRFEIPVRRPDVWRRPDVTAALTSTLGFLTDDRYEFGFTRHPAPVTLGNYVTDELSYDYPTDWEEVMLFSGGLDSLAGAVLEVLQAKHKVVLVSHRPVSKLAARQTALAAAIGSLVPPTGRRPLHVSVEVNKGKALGKEFTQRSRSFLFASLGAVVARVFGLRRVRFYENGVTSLNLPPSPQVIGGRASRTTHPLALAGFRDLFSLLFGTAFEVDNPFEWRTKADLLRGLKVAGYGELCALAVSCAHTWEQTLTHPHCGRCSQCIDRRVNAIAAGLTAAEDDPDRYRMKVLTDPRDGADLILAERYVGAARTVDRMAGAAEFLREYPQVADALRGYPGLPSHDAGREIYRMYKHHSEDVLRALLQAVNDAGDGYIRGEFPASLLSMSGVQGGGSGAMKPGGLATPRPADDRLVVDRDRFTAWWRGKPCELGNTVEFRLFDRLAVNPGAYIPVDSLADDVWGDDETEKTAIQRAASNLRRRITDAGWAGVTVDGSQRGHYALLGLDGRPATTRRTSAKTQR